MIQDGENKLPKLNPLLKLHPSGQSHDGQPQWTLYHPMSNQFYKIGWAEFECLSRFHQYDNANDLIAAVNAQTTLTIDADDIQNLLQFLATRGLLEGKLNTPMDDTDKPLWHRVMHGYLYFTIPLFKPQAFLDKTIHIVRPIFSQQLRNIMMIILAFAVLITLPRIDEFFASFTNLFTMEGAILTAFIFTAIKIIHELAHAYMAKIHDVPVPHMGLAFIVLYPIFYTEATGAWRLTDKHARMAIGLAGVRLELYIAAFALIAWHFLDPGLGQMTAFIIVTVSLVGSLLINLNPLMRFDGYYVLSDYVGIENLHSVALDYARHHLRKTLLGWRAEPPHDYDAGRVQWLIAFGYTVMIYRFFLFLGIAILVYTYFMKPLGLIAMILELVWFIGLPIYKEFKIWWEGRANFIGQKRFYIFLISALGLFVFVALPTQSNHRFKGVYHAQNYQNIYASAPSVIELITVAEGQNVAQGDLLIRLVSPQLSHDIRKAEIELKSLQDLKRRQATDIDYFRQNLGTLDMDIEAAQQYLNNLKIQADGLNIRADFDGVVKDLKSDLRVGLSVSSTDLLVRVIDPNVHIVTAYVPQRDLDFVQIGDRAVFRPEYSLWGGIDAWVKSIAPTNINILNFPELSSVHGGPIAAAQDDKGITPLNSLYAVTLSVEGYDNGNVVIGTADITGQRQSRIMRWIKGGLITARQELSLN